MLVFLWFATGYLVASVPIGLLIGRMVAGIDIRRYGTGNIGASNTFHNVGLVPAAIVGVGSFLQGCVPAWAAWELTHSLLCLGAAGVGATAGYAWSFLLRFSGGRAVGTATGALAVIAPAGLVLLLAFYALGGLLRRPAPAVLLGLLADLALLVLIGTQAALVIAAALVVLIVVLKRLEGAQADLHGARPAAALVDRLVHDRRRGQRLVGPH
jgi:acyl phosphate:glycerol-3-phosphate acyltransferase